MGNLGPGGAPDSKHGQEAAPCLVETDGLDLAIDADDFFEMSIDNLCVAGLDGYLKRVNPSWTRTLGWTAEELIARPSVDFVHPDDREATLAGRERLRSGMPLGNHTNRYLCKDGTYRWFEWRSIAHDDRGLVYCAARDITDQKAVEARLREAKEVEEKLQAQLLVADRMASIGTLAVGVAHEINNPLATVIANVTLLIEELHLIGPASPPGRMKELIEMALDARAGAERIRTIVGGLDTFSRVEAEHRAVIDVRSVLERAIDMANSAIRQRARLVRDYGPIPLVLADQAGLTQVFINLLVNAAQALTEGRSATNEIRVVTSTDAGGRAVVEVRDTGPAIPAAVMDRVFDPFFTTKPVGIGTGLGLSVCHNIVSAMGGEITVASDAAHGTSFRVVLPAALEVRDAPVSPDRPARTVVSGAVLVVDDEPAVGRSMRRVLREHDVTVVTRAMDGLELLGAGKRFDIIISDLMMPGMSGMDFYDELVRRFPETAARVVFVSGAAFTPSASAFLDRLSNERILKPFDPQRLRETVARYVTLETGPGNERVATPSR